MQQKEIVRTVRGARQVSEMLKCYETKKNIKKERIEEIQLFRFFSIEKKRK